MDIELNRILSPLFWLVVIASFPSVIWFFKIRKTMIKRQILIIKTLEDKLKVKDKRYTVHGYLVGFTGKYWINHGNVIKAWAFYTTPPYHVFFYLPIIHLFKKKERLDITLELKKTKTGGIAHIVVPKDRYVHRLLEIDLKKTKPSLPEGRVTIDGNTFAAFYNNEETLGIVEEIYRKLSQYEDVRRVSIIGPSKSLYVSIIPKVETLPEFIDTLFELANELGNHSQ